MKKTCMSVKLVLIFSVIMAAIIYPAEWTDAQSDVRLSKGQTVYVPVYSHIYYGDRETPYYLAVTVSIRNIDQTNPLVVTDVDYYDTNGVLLKKYLDKPVRLGPNGSTRFVVKESDDKGGSGANIIVVWRAEKQVNAPIVESIMIGTRNQQGISFTSRGQAVGESGK
ncbi:MAG TPA: DUF3124 domain-containing protein [Syntrophorhabdaceae bacterium]|jgi:hypothetical protein